MQRAMASGKPIPPALANAPELYDHNVLFWYGFTDLVNSRTIGMETGPIPWHHIWYYCQQHELDDEQTDDMLYFVRNLDSHQLTGAKAAQDKKIAQDNRPTPRQRQQAKNK